MQKLLSWLDQNLLTILAGLLIVFIPLYPKIPLIDALPGYNVRIRLEDILILFSFLFFIIKVLTKKIIITKAPLLKSITLYLVIGLLSVLSAIFITKTVYPEYIQVAKIFLHWFRRIEYFSLFFIFFFALKTKKNLNKFLSLIGLTALVVSVYGFGQKYFYWPGYSTMNREFAKGIPVYLTQHARIMSTFGGHFDLAAYIMLTVIPLMVIGFLHQKRWVRFTSLLIAFFEYFILVLSASRTSWIAYLVGVNVALLLLLYKKSKVFIFTRWLGVMFVSIILMISIGEMSQRFAHILNLEGVKDFITKPFKKEVPPKYISIDDVSFEDQLELVATDSDTPPSTTKPKPKDVYYDPYPDIQARLATGSAEEASAAVTMNTGYSQNALKYGLSTGIRLDALWPNAINGFKKNPLLGSGYSTLSKNKVWEFTFTESTDNDYLRLLGETGLLGLLSYLSIFIIILKNLFAGFTKTDNPFYYGIFAASIAITVGLLVNATYIDVFESSKVAYTYWSFIGLSLALNSIKQKHEPQK